MGHMTRTSDWSRSAGRAGFSDQLHDLWASRPARFPKNGPLAGVAAGFGRRYNVDPVLVRVAFVVSALFGGAGIVLYLLSWLLLNQTGDQSSAAESLFGRGQSSQTSSKTIVLLVALGIAVTTVGPVGVGLGGSGVLSFGLMLAGWWLLYQRQPQPPAGYLEQTGGDSFLNTGYPGTTNSYWTGVPGNAVTFETYGPYTTLPDHYEPAQQQFSGDERPTESFAAQHMSQSTTEAATEVLGTESATAQQLPVDDATAVLHRPDAAPADNDTVVLHKTESASGSGDSDSSPVNLDKAAAEGTASAETPGTDGPPAADDLVEPRVLHRIPPANDRPRTGYGPAPISPEFGPTPPGWDPFGVSPLAWDLPEPYAAPQQTVAPTPERRPRSRLTAVTIGFAILAAAAAGSVAASGVDWMSPARIGAAALAVIAIGLIIGAFLRRGHGLMLLLAPLAGFVILASLVGPIQFDKGAMGDHTWTAATATELQPEYHVTMGSGTLDLRGLQLTENRAVKVSVRMGDARVMLPPNLRVNTTCDVRMGDSNCVNGISGPATGPVLDLTVDVQMGNAEVKHG